MARKSQRQMARAKWVKDDVREIYAMFHALRTAYDALPDKSGIDESFITFDGFDANNEDEYLEAARELAAASREIQAFNSHMPRVSGY